jgi:L-lactate dehydrogenase complex protein LldF
MGWLAKASSLCGACEEVCPVKIPIPRMLLQLRDEGVRSGAIDEQAPWGLYAKATTSDWKWRIGLKMLPMASQFPHPLKDRWAQDRTVPHRTGRSFRKWWHGRS